MTPSELQISAAAATVPSACPGGPCVSRDAGLWLGGRGWVARDQHDWALGPGIGRVDAVQELQDCLSWLREAS